MKKFLAYVEDGGNIVLFDNKNKFEIKNNYDSNLNQVLDTITELQSCVCSTNEPGVFHISIPAQNQNLLSEVKNDSGWVINFDGMLDEDFSSQNQIYIEGEVEENTINAELVYSNSDFKNYIFEFNTPIDSQILSQIKTNKGIKTLSLLTPAKTSLIDDQINIRHSVDVEKSYVQKNIKEGHNWWKKHVNYPIKGLNILNSRLKKLNLCILDNGIEYNHIALHSSLLNLTNSNRLPDNVKKDLCVRGEFGLDVKSHNKCPKASNGYDHGMQMTGLIAADWDRTESMLPGIPFYSYKITNSMKAKPSDVLKGLEAAINNDTKLINFSYFQDWNQCHFDRVMEKIKEKNIIIVTAAGNDSRNLDRFNKSFGFKKYKENLISVTAIDNKNVLLRVTYGSMVTIAAPGTGLGSLTIASDTYTDGAGLTSAATALTTGAIAILLSKNMGISPHKVIKLIKHSNSTAISQNDDKTNIPILHIPP